MSLKPHLSDADLVDLAEGTRPESSAPHLASCEACRRQLADLRAMLADVSITAREDVAADAEPSPLFWDRFQQRVSSAVAAESERGARSRLVGGFSGWRMLVPAATLAALVIAVTINSRVTMPVPPEDVPGVPRAELLSDSLPDDASLQLVADLTSSVDSSAEAEPGLAAHGGAEHAVSHLSAGELRELQRLLQAELANSGA